MFYDYDVPMRRHGESDYYYGYRLGLEKIKLTQLFVEQYPRNFGVGYTQGLRDSTAANDAARYMQEVGLVP